MNFDFDEVVLDHYDGLYLPGGRAPEYLRMNDKVLEMVRHFLNTNKPIGVICHGVQLITAAGGITDRSISCYPACATELKLAGAKYTEIGMDEAVVDGNIVSGPAWPAHSALLSKFIKLIGIS